MHGTLINDIHMGDIFVLKYRQNLREDVSPSFYPLQTLTMLIEGHDIVITDLTRIANIDRKLRGTRGNNVHVEFFDAVSALKTFGFITHEQTKSSDYQLGVKNTDKRYPLIFLAAKLNKTNMFAALLGAFEGEIDARLVDDVYRANLLHHIYGCKSRATVAMIEEVFKQLEARYTPEMILAMIHAKDVDGYDVLDYAVTRDRIKGTPDFRDHLIEKVSYFSAKHAVIVESSAVTVSSLRDMHFGFFAQGPTLSHQIFDDLSQVEMEQEAVDLLAHSFNLPSNSMA